MLRKLVKSLPYIHRLHEEIAQLKTELHQRRTRFPPGHFYSPIPSLEEVRADAGRIFNRDISTEPGIDLGEDRQLELLRILGTYHQELPEAWQTPNTARYHFENAYYSWADGVVLFGMLRHLRPRRLVEVGSGFSSALTLDTNEQFFKNSIACTFIEPNPERLLGLIDSRSKHNSRVVTQRVQEVPLTVFTALQGGDILFIDSSHVSKTGSDVNHLLFQILPLLKSGVWIHFHDIFYPFEYPQDWVNIGVAWNEAYLLRAFLQYNSAFKIEFFTSYLIQRHREAVEQHLPLALKSKWDNLLITDSPGGSLWLHKI